MKHGTVVFRCYMGDDTQVLLEGMINTQCCELGMKQSHATSVDC